jgi:hypothetical protein
MSIKISEKYRPHVATTASALAVTLGAMSQSILPVDFSNKYWVFESLGFQVHVPQFVFWVGLIFLLLMGFLIEFSKDAESGEKHTQLETALGRVRSFIGQIALTAPPDFIGALKQSSEAFFYSDRVERSDLQESELVYRDRAETSVRRRLMELANLTRHFFPEMEKSTIGVNLMRYIPVKGNEEFVKSKNKDFIFKGGLETLSNSKGVLYLLPEYAVTCKNETGRAVDTVAQRDDKVAPICFPVHEKLEESLISDQDYLAIHLPGAPEAYILQSAVFYSSGQEFVDAAEQRKLPSDVQRKVAKYFSDNAEQIQSVISLPLSFTLHSEQQIEKYEYVLNIHCDRQIQASDSQVVLFESLISPFLASLAEKIPFIDIQSVILSSLQEEE